MDTPLFTQDLDHILEHTRGLWDELREERLFITGGTGFFGTWLLESFCFANERLNMGSKAVVLTRNPEGYRARLPHLALNPAVELYTGDVRDFLYPAGDFPFIVHAATEASAKLNQENPRLMFDTIVEGTRHVLEFSSVCGCKKLLFTSSGAVYGKQPPEMTHIPEDYPGGPDPLDPGSAYGEGKRAAEMLCSLYEQEFGIGVKIARCFAFVGPHLPMDAHFAIGNFIRDALRGGPIRVNGDGSPYRSYLYAADLAIWLWTILVKGESARPYNVGSELDLPIAQIANTVCQQINQRSKVEIAQSTDSKKPTQRYVPSIKRAQMELGLKAHISLENGVRLTANWVTGAKK
ncbi:MAG: NAD-dependent epimerase/dehydratase family protein [Anaerolineaceae bacterium]|nr:NAD-dependent epimerase/dehydratase family protein [Anaerolineaceae bacterium]